MTVRTGFGMAMLAAFLVAGTGCANKTNAEMDGLRSQNEEFKRRADAESARASALEQKVSMMTAQNTAPTPEPIATPSMEGSAGLVDLSAGGRGVTARGAAGRTATPPDSGAGTSSRLNSAGEVVIEISGDVLFDSGKVTLKPTAIKTLDNVAATLKKQYAGSQIRIEGHTDPAPVKSSGFDDNYDLGFVRARAVMKHLASKGIPEKTMEPASLGASQLKSTTNFALDRRVEIVVVKSSK